MIGSLLLPEGIEATLEDDGKWSCKDEYYRYRLNQDYTPDDPIGIDSLFPVGIGAIERAGSDLNAIAIHSYKSVPLGNGEIS